ncbi:MAG: FtsX-like permease family protein [Treponema sp.]|nr:FtsX-like permease family protein [Treponema sp.]
MYYKISIRSLLSKWKQYISLFIVTIFGVGISLFLLFAVKGMLSAMATKAKIYYGGDLQILGGTDSLEFFNADELREKIEAVMPENAVVSKRYTLRANDVLLYNNGMEARFRQMIGVDFNREKELFKRFNYVDGSAENITEKNGILLSQPIAELLGVHAGDEIDLHVLANGPGKGAVKLIVKGIFHDSSVFGMYTIYFDFDFLISLNNKPEGFANRIGVYFPDGSFKEKKAKKYQKILESAINMYPLVEDKDEFYDKINEKIFEEPTFALITIDSSMEELTVIIEAMNWVSMLIILALVVIIIVGVSSTYRVLIMKRINEIGIFKAIGMSRFNIYRVLISETACLMLAGCIIGFMLAVFFSWILSLFNLSFIPAFDVFLSNGFIIPKIEVANALIMEAIIFVTTLAAVVLSIRKAVRITPVQALSTTE